MCEIETVGVGKVEEEEDGHWLVKRGIEELWGRVGGLCFWPRVDFFVDFIVLCIYL